MSAPRLPEDAGDREIPCRVAPLQSSTAFLPAYVVDQHPYSGTNLVGHGSHAWKTSGARCRRINPKLDTELASDVPDQFIARHVALYKRVGEGSIPKLMFPRTRVVGKFTSVDGLVDLIRREGI